VWDQSIRKRRDCERSRHSSGKKFEEPSINRANPGRSSANGETLVCIRSVKRKRPLPCGNGRLIPKQQVPGGRRVVTPEKKSPKRV
jgi:hypothetical protein